MATKTLSMSFTTTGDSTASLSLANPKEDITVNEVRGVMAQVVNADVFTNSKGEGFAAVKGAKVTTTDVETLF